MRIWYLIQLVYAIKILIKIITALMSAWRSWISEVLLWDENRPSNSPPAPMAPKVDGRIQSENWDFIIPEWFIWYFSQKIVRFVEKSNVFNICFSDKNMFVKLQLWWCVWTNRLIRKDFVVTKKSILHEVELHDSLQRVLNFCTRTIFDPSVLIGWLN